jgi:hypothetical protein
MLGKTNAGSRRLKKSQNVPRVAQAEPQKAMGRAAAAGGGQRGSGETAMVEGMQELRPPPAAVGYLEVLITSPDSKMPGCKAWPAFCFLKAYLDEKYVDLKLLPIARGDADAEKNEMDTWGLFLSTPVGSDWRSKSLDLIVRRIDFVPVQGDEERRLLIRGGPHTSGCEVVVGVAQVNLADALLVRDDDEKDGKKRRRLEATAEGCFPRMKGTLEFSKTVTLLNWEVTAPPLGTAGSALRLLVSRGTVNVRMAIFQHA